MPDDKIKVLILDGESGQALKAARCLAEDDRFEIHAVSRTESAVIRLSRHVRSFHVIDRIESEKNYLDQIARIIEQRKINLLFPILESSFAQIAEHRDRFEALCALPPMPDIDKFGVATDKRLLGAFMYDHGIPAPRTYVFDDPTTNVLIDTLEYPVLAKPGKGGFGRDIHRLDSSAELRAFLSDPSTDESRYAVQPFIAGSDIDCSVICSEGKIIAHTVQRTIIKAKRTYGPPTGIEFVEDPEVLEIVRQLMFLLGWSGVAHVDLRADHAGKYYVLEINARYWGSLLGSLAAGVNFPLLSAMIALGEDPPSVKQRPGRYGIGPLGFQKRRAQARAGIPLANTQFAHMLKDPIPDVVETAALFRDGLVGRLRRKK